MFFWLGLIIWLVTSGVNCYLARRFDLFGSKFDFVNYLIIGFFVSFGPVAWLVVILALVWTLFCELLHQAYERWVLPRRWPGMLRRHDELLTIKSDEGLPLELKGWPKFELGVSGGLFGSSFYQKIINLTLWYGAKRSVHPHQAVVVYVLRWGNHADALTVRTDLWRIKNQLQPVALIVWSCTGEPMPLMRQAIADLVDTIIVYPDRQLDLKGWTAEHRPDLLPLLAHNVRF